MVTASEIIFTLLMLLCELVHHIMVQDYNFFFNLAICDGYLKKDICSDRILTCRIKSICSPAKGGTGCYRFNYQPGS